MKGWGFCICGLLCRVVVEWKEKTHFYVTTSGQAGGEDKWPLSLSCQQEGPVVLSPNLVSKLFHSLFSPCRVHSVQSFRTPLPPSSPTSPNPSLPFFRGQMCHFSKATHCDWEPRCYRHNEFRGIPSANSTPSLSAELLCSPSVCTLACRLSFLLLRRGEVSHRPWSNSTQSARQPEKDRLRKGAVEEPFQEVAGMRW